MRSRPIAAAHIEWSADGRPFAPQFRDVYHARDGACGQAEHVFLRGNDLPARWQGRRRFVVLETGFGLGRNFISTWAAWRADPARCERLHFIAVDLHPPRRDDLARAWAGDPQRDLARGLLADWPALSFNLHRRVFEGGRVELLLAFGDAGDWLRELQAEVDAFYLDGFAPDRNPRMWSEAVFAALPALAAPGATAATWSAARQVRDGLARAGFEVQRAPGFAAKRDMTVARFAPRHAPYRSPRRRAGLADARSALVVGAGLAGAATAAALAEQGLEVTVVDGAARPACGGSGNPAGLFRATVQRDDGVHARWYRAAALEAERVYRPLTGSGRVAGTCAGVLQPGADASKARALLQRLGWPTTLLDLADPARAEQLAGLPGTGTAWLFAAGGWLDPVQLVACWLDASAARVVLGRRVARLLRAGDHWLAVDGAGHAIAAAPLVVLANASAAAELAPWARWPLQRTRGQVTRVAHATPGLCAPRIPLASNGYVLTLPGGDVLCGATTETVAEDDADADLRAADHRHNLQVLERLTGQAPRADPAQLGGRVGWRCATPDRLPIVGPIPGDEALLASARRLDQPRMVPRMPGLFACTALGSRGITSAVLCGRIVAGWATGAPLPVEAGLLDAVDPARFVARQARRG